MATPFDSYKQTNPMMLVPQYAERMMYWDTDNAFSQGLRSAYNRLPVDLPTRQLDDISLGSSGVGIAEPGRIDVGRNYNAPSTSGNPELNAAVRGITNVGNFGKTMGTTISRGVQGRSARKQAQAAAQTQALKQQYSNMYAGVGGWYGQAYQQGSQASQQAQTSQQAQANAQTMMGGYTGDIDPFGSAYATATQQFNAKQQAQQQQQEADTAQRQQKVMQDVYGGQDYRSVYESAAQEAAKRTQASTPVNRPEPAWKATAQERDPNAPPPGAPSFEWRDQLRQQQATPSSGAPKSSRRPAGPNVKAMSRIAQELNSLNT